MGFSFLINLTSRMGPLTGAVLSLLKHSEQCPQCAPVIIRKVFTEEFLSWSMDSSSQFFPELGNCQSNQTNCVSNELKTDFSEDYVAISVGSDVNDPSDLCDITLDDISSDSDLLDQLERNNPEFIVTFEDVTIAQDQSPTIKRLIDESLIPVPDELEYVSSDDDLIYEPDLTYEDITILDNNSVEQAKFEELYCTIENSKPRRVSVSSSSSADIQYASNDNEEELVIGLQFIVRYVSIYSAFTFLK